MLQDPAKYIFIDVCHKSPVIKHQGVMRQPGRLGAIMGGEHDGNFLALINLFNYVNDDILILDVYAGSGLITEKNPGLKCQSPGNGYPLGFPP